MAVLTVIATWQIAKLKEELSTTKEKLEQERHSHQEWEVSEPWQ